MLLNVTPGTGKTPYSCSTAHIIATLSERVVRWVNNALPMLCQVCQIPMAFTEPDDPTRICQRESTYHGMKSHVCSDGCKDVFDGEPAKYVQAWLPAHQIYQGHCFPADTDPTAPGFEPLAEVLRYYGIQPGQDGGEFNASPDKRNWERWTGTAVASAPSAAPAA